MGLWIGLQVSNTNICLIKTATCLDQTGSRPCISFLSGISTMTDAGEYTTDKSTTDR